MNETDLEAGKIVSTHGIRGEVKVLPWADSPEDSRMPSWSYQIE